MTCCICEEPATRTIQTRGLDAARQTLYCDRHAADLLARANRTRPVERRDRYTINVDGQPIRATEEQESRIRALDAEQRSRFLRIMGRA